MPIRPYQTIQPTIDNTAFIDPTSVIIGDVVIGKNSSVWPTVVVRGDVNYIRIGENTSIQDGSILHVTHAGKYSTEEGFPLYIGNNVTVGHRVTLHGCRIDDNCLIGMGSIVLDNAHVHSHVVLGAASLVPPGKILESGYLYLGQPAKKIRALTPEELEFFEYSAKYYVKLKNTYI